MMCCKNEARMADAAPTPHYRSLVPGGYFSDDPPRPGHLKPGHTARASNNPGAVNASHAWIESFPGYVYKCETTPGNWTAIFEAPEYGIACWWKVLEQYKKALDPDFSLHKIIYTYCGPGREEEAADYLRYVTGRTKLAENYIVDLSTDAPLLSIARAFFRYEAGEESPVLDAQIEYGFNFARQLALDLSASLDAAYSLNPNENKPKLKELLEKNEIFFKTITAFLLSAMALVVSAGQFYTAREQVSLVKLQTQIAEAKTLPQFEVAVRQVLKESGKFDETRLIIDNHGGEVHEFSAMSIAVITLKTAFGVPVQSRSLDILLSDYFPAQAVSSGGAGLLTTFQGGDNNRTYFDYSRQISDLARARGLDFGLSELRIFTRLEYYDLLNRPHVDYFRVPHVGGGRQIDAAEGEEIFDRWHKSTAKVSLSSLDANKQLDDLVNAPATR
jgi:hypothetical protein